MDDQFIKERKRVKSVFNLTSIIYPLIEISLKPLYHKGLNKLKLPENLTIIDFATGTGALAGVLNEYGHTVRGIDFSPKLLKRARKKFPYIQFDQLDLFELEVQKTPAVEMVSMGFLLHGLSPKLRKIILRKAAYLAKQYVLIFDYSSRKNLVVEIIEFLEGSYYHEFIQGDHKQMFRDAGLDIIKEFNVSGNGCCWLCRKQS
ncbi:MAG: class I SAM-dependent methyltransferase [Calditrichaceae bacterium]|jgi:predicted TPR repeat methyltransferase